MITITDLKEFRQLETSQCKAAIYFDEDSADTFFALKKKLKTGGKVVLEIVEDGRAEESTNPRLEVLCASIKSVLEEAYEEGKTVGAQKVFEAAGDPDKLVNIHELFTGGEEL